MHFTDHQLIIILAPAKAVPAPKGGSTDPKPVTRPQTSAGPARKPATKKANVAAASSTVAVNKSAPPSKPLPTELDLSPEEVDEQAAEILPPDVVEGLVHTDWKTRLSAVESFTAAIGALDSKCGHSQILIRIIAKKPGLKENNFQVRFS